LIQEQGAVGRGIGILSGIAGRADTRRAAQSVHLQAGIIGHRGQTGEPVQLFSFLGGVALERFPVLDDVRRVRKTLQGDQFDPCPVEDRHNFTEFVRIPGRNEQFRGVWRSQRFCSQWSKVRILQGCFENNHPLKE
jgi:hypothetical protein